MAAATQVVSSYPHHLFPLASELIQMYTLLLLYRRASLVLFGPEIFDGTFEGIANLRKKGLYNFVGVCYYLFRQGM
jgi:hypothetical protein